MLVIIMGAPMMVIKMGYRNMNLVMIMINFIIVRIGSGCIIS